MKEVTIRLARVKETKRMVVFEERPEAGSAPVLRSIYVEKWFAQGADEIEVTVKLVE